MIKKTKKSLQEEVRVLQKELEYIKAKEKKAKEKPLYVVYPEHDYADLWYRKNEKDIYFRGVIFALYCYCRPDGQLYGWRTVL